MPNNLLNFLLEKDLLDKDAVQEVKDEALERGVSFDIVLLDKGLVSEENITKAKSELFGIPYKDLSEQKIEPDVLHIFPEHISKNYLAICFAKEDKKISVALVNPQDLKALEAIEFLAKENSYAVEYYIISQSSFDFAFKKYKVIGEEVEEVLQLAEERLKADEGIVDEADALSDVVKKAPVSKIVNSILKDAVALGASDIHIEPGQEGTRVRYRIDGILKEKITLPAYIHSSVISRIKVLANLKLDETRKPQDGRIKTTIDKEKVDLRVSILPLIDDEKAVMRVLDTSGKVWELSSLGFRKKFVETISNSVKKSHGLLLVTGPTGAGKSTTLYATLGMLNNPDVNISTLEDPVEKFIPGVNQSQINPEVGFTFAVGLRALLRQDPNIIMVGEIRDNDTAELAVHAALTGHFVFATLHTNDAIGAIPRLIDMEVEPFLLVSTVEIIMAQRLVRTVCGDCKKGIILTDYIEKEVRDDLARIPKKYLNKIPDESMPLVVYEGEGCAKCGHTGYKGRTTIAEIIVMTDELRKAVTRGSKRDEIQKALVAQDMLDMKQDGLLKALDGKTTVQEVLRVMKE